MDKELLLNIAILVQRLQVLNTLAGLKTVRYLLPFSHIIKSPHQKMKMWKEGISRFTT